MPETNEQRAAVIEQELADAATEARTEAQTESDRQRIDRLENELAELRKQPAAPAAPVVEAPPVEPPPAAPAPDADAEWKRSVDERLAAIAEMAQKPAEVAGEAAGAVVDTVADAGEETAEIVESLPKRTHVLFKPLFGRHD